MQMGWDAAKKIAESHSGGDGKFFKLENDGDKAVIVICGEPMVREVVWTGTGYAAPDSAEGKKALKNPDTKPAMKVKLNVFTISKNGEELKKPVMQIQEIGTKVFQQFHKVISKYGMDTSSAQFPFCKMMVEIERNGAKGDNKTTYSVLADDRVSPEILSAMKESKLHRLDGDGSDDSNEAASNKATGSDDFDFSGADKKREEKTETTGPIDVATKDEITARLKKFADPKATAGALFAKISMQGGKVAEIPAAKKADALAALAALEKERDGGGAAEENDDF